jgi:hypothetical protein
MFRKFILQPAVWHVKPLEFEWDATAGEFRGDGAARVRELCDYAQAAGGVVSHPEPTFYPIRDPLHRIEDLAVVLGQWWHLDEALAKAHPVFPDDDDEAPEIQVVY